MQTAKCEMRCGKWEMKKLKMRYEIQMEKMRCEIWEVGNKEWDIRNEMWGMRDAK